MAAPSDTALGRSIAAYVAARRSQGYKFVTGGEVLGRLDRLASETGLAEGGLSRELVEAFVAPVPGEAARTRGVRVSAVRCLGSWLASRGEPAYVVPKGAASGVAKYGSKPRLLTEGEVARLLSAADSMAPRPQAPLRHLVMPALFRTVYACGLRISEALNLAVDDVDLAGGVIYVRGAKFNKDRAVPMSDALSERLRGYSPGTLAGRPGFSAFFPSPFGFYEHSSAGLVFRTLLQAAGIPHYDDGPTVHSLRHSFACHRLARWAAAGEDVGALLPYLSAYMGHEGLLGTERYLRLTAEMRPDLRGRIEKSCSWMIPGAV